MPQMSPLMWEILYLSVSLLMVATISKKYFFVQCEQKNTYKLNVSNNQSNWTW